MTFNQLQDFLNILDKKGLLHHIHEPVSTELEITEICRRVLSDNGPAIMFHNTYSNGRAYKYPVLANLFGTQERVALGLNTKVENLREIGQLLAFLRQPEPPSSLKEIWNLVPLAKKVMSSSPKTVSSAKCQEVVFQGEEVDLYSLPIQKCWPGDVGPLITWPLVITKAFPKADGKEIFNMGVYRLQLLGKNKLLVRWLNLRGGAQHYQEWNRLSGGKSEFPIAIVIGADPTVMLSAVMPLPENISEYNFAGLLKGQKISITSCKTIDLKVPATAEIILEGTVSFEDYEIEGPFGDHTGYYNETEKFPVLTVKAITHRANPIYVTTYTGKPPDEPSIIGEAFNEIVVPILKRQFPEIEDFWLPPEGCSYRVAVVSIRKSYPGQARRIMMGIWSFLRQFIYTKYVIVVDYKINIRDWKEVIWAISTKTDPRRDITMIDNTPIDYLDFASPAYELGSKLGIDATDKIYPETIRSWGKTIEMPEHIIEKIDRDWKKYKF